MGRGKKMTNVNRSATHTIKGYLYQFNLTILTLLEQNPNDQITVEGIEDIDIFSADQATAIQCKYHECTEYNHSAIKDAIQWMLHGYKRNLDNAGLVIQYRYFGHFKSGHSKLNLPLDIPFLKKNLLTTKSSNKKDGVSHTEIKELHTDLQLTDDHLNDFINCLEINIHAPSYEELENKIFFAFQNEPLLNCKSEDEARNFYYGNSINVISELSRQHDIDKRKITKNEFLQKINTKQYFFTKWFLAFKTQQQYISFIKKEYFPPEMNISPYERFFLIDTKGSTFKEVKSLVLKISNKYTKNSKLTRIPYCPYIYLHNFTNNLSELKMELQSEGIHFIDGFNFENADFFPKSLIKQVDYHNRICLKFINRLEHLDTIIPIINKTKEIYQFNCSEAFYAKEHNNVMQVIIAIQSTNDIKGML